MSLIPVKLQHPITCPAIHALAALADESEHDFGVALVGGAVRDAYHGVHTSNIADHDIALYSVPDEYEPVIGDRMVSAGYSEVARFSDEGDYADGQIWLVVKYGHPVFPNVDLLYHPQASTVQDVFQTFDFNINMFGAIVADDQLTAFYGGISTREAARLDGAAPDLLGDIIDQPQSVLQDNVGVDLKRVAKMVLIADLLDWAVPPRIRNRLIPAADLPTEPWS
ncbi:tRNA nucleotidyltransferase [Pseudomonas phage Misse]|nr:tRNA nucleotidyltransferase [Pseudomonas phage Misse]